MIENYTILIEKRAKILRKLAKLKHDLSKIEVNLSLNKLESRPILTEKALARVSKVYAQLYSGALRNAESAGDIKVYLANKGYSSTDEYIKARCALTDEQFTYVKTKRKEQNEKARQAKLKQQGDEERARLTSDAATLSVSVDTYVNATFQIEGGLEAYIKSRGWL